MADEYKLNDKNERFLHIFTRILNNERLSVSELTEKFGCSQKTIDRDFNLIEEFFADFSIDQSKNYSIENVNPVRNEPGIYQLVSDKNKFMSRSELLAVCKIILESRGLSKKEINPIIEKLIENCLIQEDKKFITDLIANEKFNYVEPTHGKDLLNMILEISKAVRAQKLVEVVYKKPNGETVIRELEPLGIIFSEFYFYFAGNLKNVDKSTFNVKFDTNPTVYRIDRIESIKVLNDSFTIEERSRFKEGEFRKKIQFMFTGEVMHVKLLVKKYHLEIIGDRLPNATFKETKQEGYDYILDAEVFGEGILIWLLGQGDGVKLIGPDALVEKLKKRIDILSNLYK